MHNALHILIFRELSVHHPDIALAVLSIAGWISKETYGTANTFFKHDISLSYTDASVKHVMESCITENDAEKHVSNLKVNYSSVRPLFHSSPKPTRKLAASAFNYYTWMNVFAASLRVGFCDEWKKAFNVAIDCLEPI